MIEAIVINRLLRWANWKMRSGVALNFPSQVSFIRLAPSTTYFRDPGIDHECYMTNVAFEKTPAICQTIILIDYISSAEKLKDKARLFGRSERVYKDCLKEAYMKLGNELDLLYEKREEVA